MTLSQSHFDQGLSIFQTNHFAMDELKFLDLPKSYRKLSATVLMYFGVLIQIWYSQQP